MFSECVPWAVNLQATCHKLHSYNTSSFKIAVSYLALCHNLANLNPLSTLFTSPFRQHYGSPWLEETSGELPNNSWKLSRPREDYYSEQHRCPAWLFHMHTWKDPYEFTNTVAKVHIRLCRQNQTVTQPQLRIPAL